MHLGGTISPILGNTIGNMLRPFSLPFHIEVRVSMPSKRTLPALSSDAVLGLCFDPGRREELGSQQSLASCAN